MKVVSGMFKSVYEILGYQTYISSKKYLHIPYLEYLSVDDGELLFNLFTREIILLAHDEWKKVKLGECDGTTRKWLVEHWYLIPADVDARTLIYTFRRCHVTKFGQKRRGLELFTIFTTTECNARCPYCYEAGCNKRSMSEETALDLAKFIETHHNPNKLHLKWFGGEPLCNSKVIDVISRYLQERGVPYDSSMVSNGYLIGDHDSGKIKDLWKLSRVQITLDGTQEAYNRTKNYVMQGNAFEKVLKNIEYLLNLEIRVNIRLNLSLDNYLDLSVLVDMLQERFGKYSRVLNVYAHPLFEGDTFQPTAEERRKLYNEYISLYNHIDKAGIGSPVGIPRIKHTHCMADDGKSTVVLPDGELGLCEHHCDDEFYGTIYCDEYDQGMIQMWSEPAVEQKECKNCFYYPVCVRLKKCPAKTICNLEYRRYIRNKTHAIMLEAYKRRFKK